MNLIDAEMEDILTLSNGGEGDASVLDYENLFPDT